jgi:serine protease
MITIAKVVMENTKRRQSAITTFVSILILFGLLAGANGISKAQADDEILTRTGENATAPAGEGSATDQVIIRFNAGLFAESLGGPSDTAVTDTLSETAGVPFTFLREMSGGAFVYRLPARISLLEIKGIAQRLLELPAVAVVEPDLIILPDMVPNDTHYGLQWHYFAPTATTFGINAPTAWDITTGSSSIVVAVIDTGITNHVEFTGRTVPGYDFINDVLVANDGDGRDSNPSDPGDWITAKESATGYFKGCPTSDSSWHGTHTAGTIGAASNNGVGVAGINWQSKILPVRVLGKCGGYMSDIIDGMRWSAGLSVTGVPANANPAKVINMSLGGAGSCSSEMQTAVNQVVAAGTTIVVSAGNSNLNASGFTPASCNGVITVAATSISGNKASYSNYGATIEISAPGGDTGNLIASTWNTGTTIPLADAYAYMGGTSMAAPHVAGVASLLYSLNQHLTPAEVLAHLQASVTAFPAGGTCTTANCGSGIVNAGAAVLRIPPTAVELLSFTATGKLRSVLLRWETASELDIAGFNIYRSKTKTGVKKLINPEIIPSLAYPGSPTGAVYTFKDKTAKPGVLYFYWLDVVDLEGGSTLYGPVKARRRIS